MLTLLLPLLLGGCVGTGEFADHRVITSDEWRYRDWDRGLREIGRLPAKGLGEHTADELRRKASAVNLINLFNAGFESERWWRDRRQIQVTPGK